jgi:pimeloyl-ACP methyl ester carboxylesterase
MSNITANGIEIEYEEKGSREDESLILVRGLGTQLVDWPEAFTDELVSQGFHVVYFDNRDVGLSQKFDASGVPDIGEIARGEVNPAYTCGRWQMMLLVSWMHLELKRHMY